MGEAAKVLIDFSGVDFSAVTNSIASAIPTVLPIVLTLVGTRKVVSFVMGMLRGA